ncbi:hypothetical protein EBR96_06865 [bacterium]|nr:hypothetical protein [bacterium]
MKRFALAVAVFWISSSSVFAARIVSLAPAVTEIVCTLNAEDQLVGISNDCNYPASVLSRSRVGHFLKPKIDAILALQPTIVIGVGQSDIPAFSALRKAGIKVILFRSPQQLSDIYGIIEVVGQATHSEDRAKEVIHRLSTEVQAISSNRPKIPPKVMVIVWHPPLTVAASNTFIGHMVEKSGGSNVIEGGFIQYPKIQRELMLYKNPDVLIVTDAQAAQAVSADVVIQMTKAAKYNGIVSTINPDLLVRPGPRFTEGMRELQAVFKRVAIR